ncbi:MAG: sigma factor-like helix-turn-helix DNA-binding protein [Clostridia bacterium]|nr:sigma factor-like helix-turn-helix DNA-binding protein [Clostridia bacterium]
MEKHIRLGILLDCYGPLLTERQRSLLDQSVNEDCSLSEIAEREGISRQGVRDAVAKASGQLEEYEAKLGLMARRKALRAELARLRQAVNSGEAIPGEIIQRLTEICDDGV